MKKEKEIEEQFLKEFKLLLDKYDMKIVENLDYTWNGESEDLVFTGMKFESPFTVIYIREDMFE